jgi:hypothetical protein
MSKLEEGTTCPCCDKYCKIYKRKLNSTMAYALIWIVKRYQATGALINIPREAPKPISNTHQHATLRHWGLVESAPVAKGQDKKHSGLWRPTQRGIDFVHRRIKVPSHLYEYNNEVQSWSDTHITIDIALGTKFSYKELMR